jgi:hypothetical protein
MPHIPINESLYDNNSDLLAAMITTHLESVITKDFMENNHLPEVEAR